MGRDTFHQMRLLKALCNLGFGFVCKLHVYICKIAVVIFNLRNKLLLSRGSVSRSEPVQLDAV